MGKTKIENSSFLLLTLAEMPVSIYKDRKERCSLQSRRILQRERCYFFWTLSSVEVEAPAGIVIIEKWQARGGWWEEEKCLPVPPLAISLFLSPQSQYDTKRPLRKRESRWLVASVGAGMQRLSHWRACNFRLLWLLIKMLPIQLPHSRN